MMLQFIKRWCGSAVPSFLFFILFLAAASMAYGQSRFRISGQLGKDRTGLVRVRYYSNGKGYADSAQVIAGKFELNGSVEEPGQADIMLNPLNGRITEEQYYSQDMREIYIEPGEMIIASDKGLKEARISGKAQQEFQELSAPHDSLDNVTRAMNKLSQKYIAEKNDSALKEMSAKLREMRRHVDVQDSIFIATHPHSQVAINTLWRKMMTEPVDLPVFEPLFNQFNEKLRASFLGKELAERLAIAKAADIGAPALEFTKPDTTGVPFSLSSKRGSYVLLFFWARTNPVINKVLADIHAHLPELEMIGISYASGYDDWLFNIRRSNMTWTNVIDLDGVDERMRPVSEVAKAYDINQLRLPQCYLLDKNGIIMARGLRVNDVLEQKIKALLGKAK